MRLVSQVIQFFDPDINTGHAASGVNENLFTVTGA